MGKDGKYDIIYRGQVRDYLIPGSWVFIQRAKEYGGGFWLGKAYDDCFWLELEAPTSLSAGIAFIMTSESVQDMASTFDNEFYLE